MGFKRHPSIKWQCDCRSFTLASSIICCIVCLCYLWVQAQLLSHSACIWTPMSQSQKSQSSQALRGIYPPITIMGFFIDRFLDFSIWFTLTIHILGGKCIALGVCVWRGSWCLSWAALLSKVGRDREGFETFLLRLRKRETLQHLDWWPVLFFYCVSLLF